MVCKKHSEQLLEWHIGPAIMGQSLVNVSKKFDRNIPLWECSQHSEFHDLDSL